MTDTKQSAREAVARRILARRYPNAEPHPAAMADAFAMADDAIAALAATEVDAGPEPASSLPWRTEQDWTHEIVGDNGAIVEKCRHRSDAIAFVHRVNTWPAVLATIAALRAENARLTAEVKTARRMLATAMEMMAGDFEAVDGIGDMKPEEP